MNKKTKKDMINALEGKIKEQYYVDFECLRVQAYDEKDAEEQAIKWLKKNKPQIVNIELA